jgi:uncharacterized protein
MTATLLLDDATPDDWPAVLALNAAFVQYLSPMDEARLRLLASESAYFRVVKAGDIFAAFLLAFRKGAAYDGTIFELFGGRFAEFLYLDRIVVANGFRGQGIADRLYDDVTAFARASGAQRLTCEVNVEPPNLPSTRFHERRGFRQIGTHAVGDKTVALLVLEL